MAVEFTPKRVLGFRDFWPNETPKNKEYYAALIGRKMIEKFCCYFLGHFRHNAIPPVREILERSFIFYDRSFNQSPSYHEIIKQFDRITNYNDEKSLVIMCIDSLLNMFIWVQTVEGIPEDVDATTPIVMYRILELYLLFNDDMLQKFQHSVDTGGGDVAKTMLAINFPQHDLVNADYAQLIYTQLYKLFKLLDFIEAKEKYRLLYEALLNEFDCISKLQFIKALGGAVLRPLGKTPGWSSLLTKGTMDEQDGYRFLERLSQAEGELTIDQDDYLKLRNKPFQLLPNGEFRIVFDLFLIKKLYNGVFFKLSEINNREKYIPSFLGDIRKEFSEGILLYEVLDEIYNTGSGKALTGDQISNDYKLPREPDYYARYGNRIVLFESKDFYMKGEHKLSYDFDVIFDELSKDGRLKKAAKQLATNTTRVCEYGMPFDKDYKVEEVTVYPIAIVHDALYTATSLNYWTNVWFQEQMHEQYKSYTDAPCRILPLTIIELDSIILYQKHFASGRLDLCSLIDGFHQHVDYTQTLKGNHVTKFGMPFSELLRHYCLQERLQPDFERIGQMAQQIGIE